VEITFLAKDRHFDFETVGAKIYRCTIAINQKNKRDRRIWTHRLVTVEYGLRQCKIRNGYEKKISSELSVRLIQHMPLCYI
jgi:hypothetical protein